MSQSFFSIIVTEYYFLKKYYSVAIISETLFKRIGRKFRRWTDFRKQTYGKDIEGTDIASSFVVLTPDLFTIRNFLPHNIVEAQNLRCSKAA